MVFNFVSSFIHFPFLFRETNDRTIQRLKDFNEILLSAKKKKKKELHTRAIDASGLNKQNFRLSHKNV